MALVERPNPRGKLIAAVLIDTAFIVLGVLMYLYSGKLIWLLAGVLVGAAAAAPLIISGLRGIREQNDASG